MNLIQYFGLGKLIFSDVSLSLMRDNVQLISQVYHLYIISEHSMEATATLSMMNI